MKNYRIYWCFFLLLATGCGKTVATAPSILGTWDNPDHSVLRVFQAGGVLSESFSSGDPTLTGTYDLTGDQLTLTVSGTSATCTATFTNANLLHLVCSGTGGGTFDLTRK